MLRLTQQLAPIKEWMTDPNCHPIVQVRDRYQAKASAPGELKAYLDMSASRYPRALVWKIWKMLSVLDQSQSQWPLEMAKHWHCCPSL
jgi:hypothetical protein